MSVTSGFYIPSTVAQGFVRNLKKDDGTYKYNIDAEGNVYSDEAALEAQRAIQSLNSSYSDTINNAYSQYLNSKRSIMNSDMGEGFKQAYLQRQEQALRDSQIQASMNAAEARQTILGQVADANAATNKAYEQEVSYMNTLAANLDKYYDYVKGLRKVDETGAYSDEGESYLSEYEQSLSVEQVYDKLFNAQPLGYKTADDVAGQSFLDWARDRISNEQDQAWFDWLTINGGYNQFKSGALSTFGDNFAKRDVENTYQNATNSKPTLDLHWTDYGTIDAGESAKDKIMSQTETVKQYVSDLGLAEDDLKELGYDNVEDLLEAIATYGDRRNNGYTFKEVFASGKGFNEGFKRFMYTMDKQLFSRTVGQGYTQTAVEDLFNATMDKIYQLAEKKRQ